MYFVYVLWSPSAGRSYVGSTKNVVERLRRHNAGHSKSTRHGIPWTPVHIEAFATRTEAMRRERHYKTGKGREELARIRAQRG